MEVVLIVLAVFSTPVAIIAVVNHYKLKHRQLTEGGDAAVSQKLLARCEELEARVQTLETIACDGDLDAASRIRAAASQKALTEGNKP